MVGRERQERKESGFVPDPDNLLAAFLSAFCFEKPFALPLSFLAYWYFFFSSSPLLVSVLLFMHFTQCSATFAPTMPAIPSEQPDACAAASYKKRKRDPLQDQVINLSHA